MKRTYCLQFIVVLVLACVLSGCSSGPKGVGAVLSSQSHKLTQEQMLADYDAMWSNIEENYPLMGVAERTTEKDFSDIKAQYRTEISNTKSDAAFYDVLENCIKEFNYTGHISLLTKDQYPQFVSIYKNYSSTSSKSKYLYKVLNNPASKTFYSFVPTDIYEEAGKEASQNGGSGNISTQIIEQNQTAYLGIKSFASQFIAVDAPKITEFFADIKDYKSCIIDIRGNGGGDTRYWSDNIVAPNIDHTIKITNYELVKDETAKKYLSTVQKLRPISEFKKLPNTNDKDLAQMKYFIENEDDFASKTGKKVFSGKFYLLTDEKVYSSSEAFASFCKQSGFAKIVGDSTGGDGIGVDPILFVLPNSGICMRFSASLGLNSDGASNEEFGTQPNIPCTQGQDALQTCMKVIAAGR